MGVRRNLVVAALVAIASPSFAALPWTIEDASHLSAIVPTCSGGVYNDGNIRTAQMIGASLPKSGEDGAAFDSNRADDVYYYAGALLKPSIVNPERALDPSSFVKCPPDPALGVKLMKLLVGDQPGQNVGPTNAYYWLGIAHRRGIGVPPDQLRAREYFLQARMLGIGNLTAEDWGTSPSDQLLAVVSKPENLRWLEAAADAGRGGAMTLLAEVVLDEEPLRAQSLLAAQPNYIAAARMLAKYEMAGRFGAARPDQAARIIARFRYLTQPDYDLMLRAARQYNAIGEDIPVSPRRAKMSEIGGDRILKEAQKQKLDAVRGVVETRALVDPVGRIIYTELSPMDTERFVMHSATLNVLAPDQLNQVAPMLHNGRPVFHWLNLPLIAWQ